MSIVCNCCCCCCYFVSFASHNMALGSIAAVKMGKCVQTNVDSLFVVVVVRFCSVLFLWLTFLDTGECSMVVGFLTQTTLLPHHPSSKCPRNASTASTSLVHFSFVIFFFHYCYFLIYDVAFVVGKYLVT